MFVVGRKPVLITVHASLIEENVMVTTHVSKSAAIRAHVNHPIIDSDGHTVEFEPAFLDYLLLPSTS
jgi:hypothetical protein